MERKTRRAFLSKRGFGSVVLCGWCRRGELGRLRAFREPGGEKIFTAEDIFYDAKLRAFRRSKRAADRLQNDQIGRSIKFYDAISAQKQRANGEPITERETLERLGTYPEPEIAPGEIPIYTHVWSTRGEPGTDPYFDKVRLNHMGRFAAVTPSVIFCPTCKKPNELHAALALDANHDMISPDE